MLPGEKSLCHVPGPVHFLYLFGKRPQQWLGIGFSLPPAEVVGVLYLPAQVVAFAEAPAV